MNRYYYVIAIGALLAIAETLVIQGYPYLGFSIAILILIFGAAAFSMQRKRDSHGHSEKESAAESSDQSRRTGPTGEPSGHLERTELDRSDSTSTGSVRASVEGEAERSPSVATGS